MARIENSPLEGLSGTLGDLVFRTWGGKTFVYPRPSKPKRQSPAQKANRTKFREASQRAMGMLVNDVTREHYRCEALRLKLPNAYTAALREQLNTL